MIIHVSARTDIPAYYTEWLLQRIKEGYVYVRNPYYPKQITKYSLHSRYVDGLVFCTKNPQPILPYLNQLSDYPLHFFVTITPYDQRIEPQVPPYSEVIHAFQMLSQQLGCDRVTWRYDPIFLNQTYTIEKHIDIFIHMIKQLQGYTQMCIISFVDLYAKTKKNFPGIQAVTPSQQIRIAKAFAHIAKAHGMRLKTCAEEIDLSEYGVLQDNCVNQSFLELLVGQRLKPQKVQPSRPGCHCYPMRDIGEYESCPHGCLYCYANKNQEQARMNYKKHDPMSPLLIGHVQPDDVIKEAKQESFIDYQLTLDLSL